MEHRTVWKQNNLRENNSKLVLDLIRENRDDPISRAQIARLTKMSATSITRITEGLMELGLVKQTQSFSTGTVGRNAFQLQVVRDALVVAGISIDSDYIDGCILDFEDRVRAKKRRKLENRPYTPQEILELSGGVLADLCREAGDEAGEIRALGISCIGNVNHRGGTVYFAPQFGWRDVEMGTMAEKAFGLPVYVDNDMKSSLTGLAHRYPEIRRRDVTYLSIGMGVGCAVMYDGTLIRGSNNASGEVGHVILEQNGRLCDCGNRGCVQTYLTQNSLVDQCREAGHEVETAAGLYQAFRDGAPWALELVNRTADHLALLLRNLVYMYNTEYILAGGAILCDFPELFDLARERMGVLLHRNLYESLRLVRVKERDNSVEGAAFFAQETYMEERLLAEAP